MAPSPISNGGLKSIVHCRGPNSCGPVTGSVNAESDLSQWRVVLGVGLGLDARPQV